MAEMLPVLDIEERGMVVREARYSCEDPGCLDVHATFSIAAVGEDLWAPCGVPGFPNRWMRATEEERAEVLGAQAEGNELALLAAYGLPWETLKAPGRWLEVWRLMSVRRPGIAVSLTVFEPEQMRRLREVLSEDVRGMPEALGALGEFYENVGGRRVAGFVR